MRHAFLFGLGLVIAAAPASARPQVWDQSWTVSGSPDVHVNSDDAHVRIHAGPAGKVSTHIEYELKRWGVVFGASTPTVVFEHKGDQIWITARDPKSMGMIGGVDEQYTVDVVVPASVTLSVRTGDGATDCEPVTGRLTFVSGDGAIRAHGLKGDIDVSSGDGRVILDDLDGRLRGRSGDGRIMVAGRFDQLDLSTGDGRIEASARKGSKLLTAWSLESGDGAVSLHIPQDLVALLDARTRDGRLNIQLPIDVDNRPKRNELIGELNGGGPSLRIRTGDGSITLGVSP